MKILRYNNNGFIYYEATAKGMNLSAFSITDLINQLFVIYSVDLRKFLFKSFLPAEIGVISHSQLN